MSQDLIARLRAKPCDNISPPAIELEAADRIEELERELAALRSLPDLLPGQIEGDISWKRVQPDWFCEHLTHNSVFNGAAIERAWNAMKTALMGNEGEQV